MSLGTGLVQAPRGNDAPRLTAGGGIMSTDNTTDESSPDKPNGISENIPEVQPAAVEQETIPAALPAPKPPHPGFGWALLWVLLFWGITQTPGSMLGILEISIGMARNPQIMAGRQQSPVQLMKDF